MKKNIGIYASNDWPEAKAYAADLRKAGDTVRLRDGASFTPDQAEPFDKVLVRGDFPAVMAAYPKAEPIAPAVNGDAAADHPASETQDDSEPQKRGPGRPRKQG